MGRLAIVWREPDTRFLMHIVEGPANSHSLIRCLQCSADKALFELKPITGKTHQLRLHMQSLGWPILHDAYYPSVSKRRNSQMTSANLCNY